MLKHWSARCMWSVREMHIGQQDADLWVIIKRQLPVYLTTCISHSPQIALQIIRIHHSPLFNALFIIRIMRVITFARSTIVRIHLLSLIFSLPPIACLLTTFTTVLALLSFFKTTKINPTLILHHDAWSFFGCKDKHSILFTDNIVQTRKFEL